MSVVTFSYTNDLNTIINMADSMQTLPTPPSSPSSPSSPSPPSSPSQTLNNYQLKQKHQRFHNHQNCTIQLINPIIYKQDGTTINDKHVLELVNFMREKKLKAMLAQKTSSRAFPCSHVACFLRGIPKRREKGRHGREFNS